MPASTLANLGATYLAMERYEEATATFKKTVKNHPNSLPAYLGLAVVYSAKGRMAEAHSADADIMKLQPNFSAEHYAQMLPYKDETYKDFILNGLQKAGLK